MGYLAGLIDGEGTITIGTVVSRSSGLSSHMLTLSIVGTDARLMSWLMDNVGGAVHSRASQKAHWKPLNYWKVNAGNAASVLAVVRPYLVIKGQQADLAARFWSLRRGRGHRLTPELADAREELRLQLRALNQRGVVAKP